MPHKTALRELAGPDNLSEAEADRLHQLLSDWQVVADLSFSDLVLWLPTPEGRFLAVAHRRPSNAPTIHVDDVVGLYMSQARAKLLEQAMETRQVVAPENPRLAGVYTVSEVIVPVVYQGRSIAVITRETANTAVGNNAQNAWYRPAAQVLCQMIARGEYPYDEASRSASHGWPRVADGALLIDEDGKVLHSTPNAVSCFRRLGIAGPLPGKVLAEEITSMPIQGPSVDESLPLVLMGRASWATEVEVGQVNIIIRAMPLTEGKKRLGAVLLCRDLTEERQRERALLTKDATIREIHHRVKNNLQTVSALLRLQARRSDSQEVRQALSQAQRRVATIASVHEALSQNVDEVVDFDPVARRVLRLAATLALSQDATADVKVTGSFGMIEADQASALSVVLSELVTNAVEHGLSGGEGEVEVNATRHGQLLEVHVLDCGKGLDPDKPISGLGTQIVKTLVASELAGTIEWVSRPQCGTEVILQCQVGAPADPD